ncbi:MAG: MCE family protein, partial [Deltaproteobacteria bacterium]|nr:MCE family protein [Deltaproteobacteria bacterium]
LQGTLARVTLRIRRDLGLRTDATLSKRSESMLGDYLLDLTLGTEQAPLMPDGGQIKVVYDKTGLDQTFDKLNTIAVDIQAVTTSLRQVLGGEAGAGNLQSIMENMVKLSTSMDQTIRGSGEKLNEVLANLEGASGAVRDITFSEGENYRQIVANVRGATEDVREVLKTVKQVLGSGEGELKESVAGLKQTLARLDQSLQNVESVTGKIDRGEGALGTLVNDKRMAEDLSQTVADASEFVNRVAGLMTEVSLRSEYLFKQRGAKNYLQLKLIPKPDKYYFFEIVDDPRGMTVEETVQRLPPDSDQRELQTVITTRQQLKYSAQFAKRYYFVTLRFGIIESTGGVGANLRFLDDSLSITADLFEFTATNKDYPRLRAYLNYSFLGHLFVTAGVDDALNRTLYDTDLVNPAARDLATRRLVSGRDYFVGGGLFFTDEDLKAILSAVPLP